MPVFFCFVVVKKGCVRREADKAQGQETMPAERRGARGGGRGSLVRIQHECSFVGWRFFMPGVVLNVQTCAQRHASVERQR